MHVVEFDATSECASVPLLLQVIDYHTSLLCDKQLPCSYTKDVSFNNIFAVTLWSLGSFKYIKVFMMLELYKH